ncbi:hypothetical protein ACHHYP_13039 [Achlya hypogyna]|uniref:M96 mating-specific protein family n=1 Tax=Achlya hypogyna TaxID=1202772 RepID=A0A1V9YG27_ACHHY|nr:hypothetical protein ACHHYP_13039 [Achlya hypogyna]
METDTGTYSSELGDLLDLLPAEEPTLDFLDQAPRKAPKRVRTKTAARDLDALRNEEAQLQLQLVMVQSLLMPSKAASPWRLLAMRQHAQRLRALRENAELRTLLAEQTAFQLHLERELRKRPRVMPIDEAAEKWKSLILTDDDQRFAAIQAIADRQYDRMESEMIALGLVDPPEDVFDIRFISDSTKLSSEGLRYTTLDMDMATAAGAVMTTMQHRHKLVADATLSSQSNVTVVDANTLYTHERLAHPSNDAIQVTTRMIVKKYETEGRFVVVWRSVLEDDRHPHPPGSSVNDEHGWICIEPHGMQRVTLRAYLKASSPMPAVKATADLQELMSRLQLDGGGTLGEGLVDTVKAAFANMFQRLEESIVRYGSSAPLLHSLT